MGNDHSCWVCAHQQIGGDTFLGLCRWFEAKGQPKKPIPPEVVDVGCKFWTRKEAHGAEEGQSLASRDEST